MSRLKKEKPAHLTESGYFFHPGGDFHDTAASNYKRGIWKEVEGPKRRVYIGTSWIDAQEHYDKIGHLA